MLDYFLMSSSKGQNNFLALKCTKEAQIQIRFAYSDQVHTVRIVSSVVQIRVLMSSVQLFSYFRV